jgi:hypothetical protein
MTQLDGTHLQRAKSERNWGVLANEDVNTEKSACAGIQTECYAVCNGGRGDVWVLEGWEGNSGTEVRLASYLLIRSYHREAWFGEHLLIAIR